MNYSGGSSSGMGMGALCKFYPELEINSVQTSANKYFCDVGAIGLINKDKSKSKYRLKCDGGSLDRKNGHVRLGRDSEKNYTTSRVCLYYQQEITF